MQNEPAYPFGWAGKMKRPPATCVVLVMPEAPSQDRLEQSG